MGGAGWFRDPTASGSSIVVGKSGASLLASVNSMDTVSTHTPLNGCAGLCC